MANFADSILELTLTTQTELDGLIFLTLQKLISDGSKFDLNQDIVFPSGFSCKPLHLLLGSNRPGFIDTAQELIRAYLKPADYEKAITEYKDSLGHPLTHYTPQSVVSSPAKQGMFAKADSHRPTEIGAIEKLRLSPFRHGFGIPMLPAQLDAILHHDLQCKTLSEGSLGRFIINPSVELSNTAAEMGHVIKTQQDALSADPSLKMTLSPVFMNDKGYELLLTTLRHVDGTPCMLLSEIMGKTAFENKVLSHVDDLFKTLGIKYHHTSNPVTATYEDKTVYSCCGTMVNLIFSTVDMILKSDGQLNLPEIIRILTETTQIDITETVSRANRAIQQSIDDHVEPGTQGSSKP